MVWVLGETVRARRENGFLSLEIYAERYSEKRYTPLYLSLKTPNKVWRTCLCEIWKIWMTQSIIKGFCRWKCFRIFIVLKETIRRTVATLSWEYVDGDCFIFSHVLFYKVLTFKQDERSFPINKILINVTMWESNLNLI